MKDHYLKYPLVNPWMASIFGALLWLPGIGIPLNESLFLQPIEVFIMGWVFFWLFPLRNASRHAYFGREILLMCACLIASWVISTVWSINPSRSLLFLSYYLLCILPGILFFYFIASNGLLFARFVSGFIFGAIASCIVGFFQIALGMHMVRLVNNKNFSLIHGLRKASGFTPEASIFAGLLIIAIMIILVLLTEEDVRLYCGKFKIATYLTKRSWIGLTLLILLSGLFCTLSSSVIFILPFVVLFGYMLLNKYQRMRTILTAVFLLMLIVITFATIVWSSRSLEDSYGSIVLRFASMVAAVKIAAANWLHGVGLGMLKFMIGELIHQNIHAWNVGPDLNLWVDSNQKDGVDSFVLHLIAEQGIIILFLFIIALGWILSFRYQTKYDKNEHELLKMVSVVAISIFLVSSFTVGYRGLLHSWLLFPCACAIRYIQKPKP
jgi:hypothetical protein